MKENNIISPNRVTNNRSHQRSDGILSPSKSIIHHNIPSTTPYHAKFSSILSPNKIVTSTRMNNIMSPSNNNNNNNNKSLQSHTRAVPIQQPITPLHSSLNKIELNIDEMNSMYNRIIECNNGLQVQVEQKENMIIKLNNEKQQLQQQIDELNGKYQILQNTNQQLEQELTAVKTQPYISLQQSHTALVYHKQALERIVTRLHAQLKSHPAVWQCQKQCFKCQAKFNFVKRRHHCRACGYSYCSSCLCSTSISTPTFISKNTKYCYECIEELKVAHNNNNNNNNSSNSNKEGNANAAVNIPIAPPIIAAPIPLAPPLIPSAPPISSTPMPKLPTISKNSTIKRTPYNNSNCNITQACITETKLRLRTPCSSRTISKRISPLTQGRSTRKSPYDVMSILRSNMKERRRCVEGDKDVTRRELRFEDAAGNIESTCTSTPPPADIVSVEIQSVKFDDGIENEEVVVYVHIDMKRDEIVQQENKDQEDWTTD